MAKRDCRTRKSSNETASSKDPRQDRPRAYTRRVSFADRVAVKGIRRIPRNFAMDVWYTAIDMENFRRDVLSCKKLRSKVKEKSFRCHNHMRRVLFEHRVGNVEKGFTASGNGESSESLSILSMSSSRETKQAALRKAKLLQMELDSDDAFMTSSLSSACFGPRQRWVFDYYLGSMIDTLCTVI